MGQERSTQLSIGLKADPVFRRGRFGKWRVPCCCLLGVKPRERERNIGNLASLFKFPSNSLFFFCYVVGIIFHFKPGSLIERPSVPCCFGNSLSHHHDLSRKPYTLSFLSLLPQEAAREDRAVSNFESRMMNFSELNLALWFSQPCGFPSGDLEIVLPWIISGLLHSEIARILLCSSQFSSMAHYWNKINEQINK